MRRIVHNTTLLSTVMLVTLSLTGCETLQLKSVTANGKCTTTLGSGGGKCEAGVTATWEPKGEGGDKPLMALLALSDIVPDAAQFTFDTTGSSIPYPSTGSVNVILTDSRTGVIQGAKVFPWVRNGNIIKLQNPDAVNSWAMQNAGTANRVDYRLLPFASPYGPGLQTLSIAAKNENVTLASVTKTFQGPCTHYPSPYQCRPE